MPSNGHYDSPGDVGNQIGRGYMFYPWCWDDSGSIHRSHGYLLSSMLILTHIYSAFGSISTTSVLVMVDLTKINTPPPCTFLSFL